MVLEKFCKFFRGAELVGNSTAENVGEIETDAAEARERAGRRIAEYISCKEFPCQARRIFWCVSGSNYEEGIKAPFDLNQACNREAGWSLSQCWRGFARVSAARDGVMRFAGRLGDNRSRSGAARLVRDETGGLRLPLAVLLNSTKGLLRGEGTLYSAADVQSGEAEFFSKWKYAPKTGIFTGQIPGSPDRLVFEGLLVPRSDLIADRNLLFGGGFLIGKGVSAPVEILEAD